jgi:hypothetical protein
MTTKERPPQRQDKRTSWYGTVDAIRAKQVSIGCSKLNQSGDCFLLIYLYDQQVDVEQLMGMSALKIDFEIPVVMGVLHKIGSSHSHVTCSHLQSRITAPSSLVSKLMFDSTGLTHSIPLSTRE